MNIVKSFTSDISNFFRFKRVLGIDIGTVSIKMMQVSKKGGALYFENYGILETKDYLERSNAVIQNSSFPPSKKETAKLLEILKNEIKPTTNKAIVSIPPFSAFVVHVDIPMMSEAEIKSAVQFQARQHIPMPLKDVALDWFKIEDFEDKDGKKYQRIFLTAIPNDLLRIYKEIFKSVGLNLVAVEIENQALTRSLLPFRDSASIIVDIGAASTSMTIAEGVTPKKTAQIDYGGMSLTHAISTGLSLSLKRAEELKKRQGLLGSERERELSTSLKTFVDVIIDEVRRVNVDFETQQGKATERLFLIGGGSLVPGIRDYFSEKLGIPFVEPSPLSRFHRPKGLEPAMRILNAELATVAGLVLGITRSDN